MRESREVLIERNETIKSALEKGIASQLMSIPGVIHVSYGLKKTAGLLSDTLCIRVYVKEKKLPHALKPEEYIPKEIDGIPTDVNIVGDISFSSDDSMHRPIKGGIAITNRIIDLNEEGTRAQMSVGTLGCMATYNPDGKPVVLSNWHVLYGNHARNGERVYQPAPTTLPTLSINDLPYRPTDDTNAIGRLLKKSITSKVDGAIAHIDGCYSLCCRCCGIDYINEIRGLNVGGNPGSNFIEGESAAVAGETVYKVGRSTDRTVGRVVEPNYPTFEIRKQGTTYRFYNQIQIALTDTSRRFSADGDSGSVIINDNNHIIGLLFASGREETTTGDTTTVEYFSLANHIADVKNELDISINITPSSSPTRGKSTRPRPRATFVADTDIKWKSLKQIMLSTERGREYYSLAEKHQEEVIRLVNQNRAVTVAWHRGRGPAFLAAIINAVQQEQDVIPKQIEENSLIDLLKAMANVLKQQGSIELQHDLEYYEDEILDLVQSHDAISQLFHDLSIQTLQV
jgi:hypothetical protein